MKMAVLRRERFLILVPGSDLVHNRQLSTHALAGEMFGGQIWQNFNWQKVKVVQKRFQC